MPSFYAAFIRANNPGEFIQGEKIRRFDGLGTILKIAMFSEVENTQAKLWIEIVFVAFEVICTIQVY